MALNIEPLDRNQTTAFREREVMREKINEIIDKVNPMGNLSWDETPTAGHGVGYAVTSRGVKAAIDTEKGLRESADSSILQSLGTEINERQQAFSDLLSAIDTEADMREDADTTLRNRIEAEETARSDADIILTNRVNSIQNTKQDKLIAGAGITIDNNTISATGIEVVIDTAMSNVSTNPVQNRVIKEYVDGKAPKQLTATNINDILTILSNGGYGFLTITFQSPNGNGIIETQSRIGRTSMSVYYIRLQGTMHVFGYITFGDSNFTLTYVDVTSLTTQSYTVSYSDLTAISLSGVKM